VLTTEQLKSLKQINISVDSEKTKDRTAQVWKSQKNALKNDVVALAGCAKATVYRVFDTGSINIKLAIAIGQVLNVNPYYLTGEMSEPGSFSDILLMQILDQHGYQKLLDEIAPPPAKEAVKPKRKYTRKQNPVAKEDTSVPEPEAEAVHEQELLPEPAAQTTPVQRTDIDLPEEDLQALLHSLVILSNAGIADAADKLAQVKGILIS